MENIHINKSSFVSFHLVSINMDHWPRIKKGPVERVSRMQYTYGKNQKNIHKYVKQLLHHENCRNLPL